MDHQGGPSRRSAPPRNERTKNFLIFLFSEQDVSKGKFYVSIILHFFLYEYDCLAKSVFVTYELSAFF